MNGVVFDIQRNSLNDGPGIRTTVFLKGCSLNCLWCHNEESIDTKPRLRFYPDKCMHCLECVKVCKTGAHIETAGKHQVSFEKCTSNWDCIAVCPSNALAKTGIEMEVWEVMNKVEKDRSYYNNSGGGLTISGGEPMVQFEYTKELLKAAKESGIHTCLDTTGHAAWNQYKAILPFVDLFLYDYKETDPEKHLNYTGVDNGLIIQNLGKLNEAGGSIILRCPIIPGLNDSKEHFKAIAELSRSMEYIREVHILPYHTMGLGKAQQHGFKHTQKEYPVPCDDEKKRWKSILDSFGAKNIQLF